MSEKNKPSVAILGTRGIPASYGGFETFAEELGVRLAERGYDIKVYCRPSSQKNGTLTEYKGVRLVHLPILRHKYLETIFHTFLSAIHVSFSKTDIVYVCNAVNAIFVFIPRLFGKRTLINVDGLEWKRAKWNALGKWVYRSSERIATWSAHQIISDSKGIQAYYREKFGKDTCFIPYGAHSKSVSKSTEILEKFGLTSRNYFLYVSRLEPENNAHLMISAYEKLDTSIPLVIVGDAPYGKPYIQRLKSTQDKRIRFLGAQYGEVYSALQSNAFAYLHGNEVGGTNPALLEAMAYGNCVIANGVSFNREVVGSAGYWFEEGNPEDLREKMSFLIQNPGLVEEKRKMAVERIRESYNWEDVTTQYESLFSKMVPG